MFDTNSNFESKITFEIPTSIDLEKLAKLNPNFTLLTSGANVTNVIDINSSDYVLNGGGFNGNPSFFNSDANSDNANNLFYSQYQNDYDRFISDVWVGIILTLMIGLSIFCICACYLYHKYQQWKLSAYNLRQSNDLENAYNNGGEGVGIHSIDIESLPSYTIVSGLPTYDDAIEEMRKNKLNYLQREHGGDTLHGGNDSNRRPSIIKLFSNHQSTITNAAQKYKDDLSPTIMDKVPAYNEILYHTVPSYEEAVNSDCSNNMNLLNEIMIQSGGVVGGDGDDIVDDKHKIPSYEETLSSRKSNSNESPQRLSIIEVPIHKKHNCNGEKSPPHISTCSNYSSMSFSSLDELLNRNKYQCDRNNSNINNSSSSSHSSNSDKFNFLKTRNLSINF